MMVQEEIARRANVKTGTGRRSVYSGKYTLSSIMFCAHCGDLYQRTYWVLKGEKIPVWRCVSRLQKRMNDINCQARTIYEKDLHAAVVKAVNQLIDEKDQLLPELKQNIRMAIGNTNSAAIREIDTALAALQKDLLQKANASQEYDQIGAEIERLRDEKQALLLEDAMNDSLQRQVDAIEAFLDEQTTEITEYGDNLVRRLIEKITVYDERMVFEFKCGLEIEVKA